MAATPVLLQGNEAVAEGAIAAGARFFAGYPITPSTEIAEVLVAAPAPGRRPLHPDGGRDRLDRRRHRRLAGRHQGAHRHLGPGLLAHAGEHRLRLDGAGARASSSTSCAAAPRPACPPSPRRATSCRRAGARTASTRSSPSCRARWPSASRSPSRPSTSPRPTARRSSCSPTRTIGHMREAVALPQPDELRVAERGEPDVRARGLRRGHVDRRQHPAAAGARLAASRCT